jgi:hypothetical protein
MLSDSSNLDASTIRLDGYCKSSNRHNVL